MLKKAHISKIKAGDEEWFMGRLGKFTSSEVHLICKPEGIGKGGRSYIRRKVGEEMTGRPAKDDIDVPATRHGLLHERDMLIKFGKKMGLDFLVLQQLITIPGTRYGSTPDALIVTRESPDGTEYEVETVEGKCPITYDAYIALFECDTPQQLKETMKDYYWQVLDQMDNCGASRAHFVIYHPDFKAGNHKSIILDRREPVLTPKGKVFAINDDLKFLQKRKLEAVGIFEEIRSKLMMVPPL